MNRSRAVNLLLVEEVRAMKKQMRWMEERRAALEEIADRSQQIVCDVCMSVDHEFHSDACDRCGRRFCRVCSENICSSCSLCDLCMIAENPELQYCRTCSQCQICFESADWGGHANTDHVPDVVPLTNLASDYEIGKN